MMDERSQQLAGEYALGTLDQAERAGAAKRLEKDQEFARNVNIWHRLLAPLAEAIPPRWPSARLWQRIESSIERSPLEASSKGWSSAMFQKQIVELRQRLSLWRLAALGASAAAVVLTLAVIGIFDLPWRHPMADEQYVAMLSDSKGTYAYIMTLEPARQRLMIRTMGVSPPASKYHELWLIKKDGSTPLTLGIIKEDTLPMLNVAGKISPADLKKGLELAVSVETHEGAPSGLSMGPVVFSGDLMRQTPGTDVN